MNADVLTIPSQNLLPIRIVQVSDPHLFEDTTMRLLGINTEDSFQSVIDLIRNEQRLTTTTTEQPVLSPAVQLFLATGDIAQSPSHDVYQRFLSTMDTLASPCVWLQGNHDLKQIFEQCGRSVAANSNIVELGDRWVVLMLNSAKDHEIGGSFSESELIWLREQLARYPHHHVIIALHHNPLPVGSTWIDASGLANADDFWDIVHTAPQVRLVIHGHSHQEFAAQLGNLSVLGCPSTCIQFKPLSSRFTVDIIPPGYRWFDLYPDGRFESAVSRLTSIPAGIDVNSEGY